MNLELIKSNKIDELEKFLDQVTVRFLSYDKKLIPLPNSEGKFAWMPRCNKVLVEVTNKSNKVLEDLLLTVYRTNSKIGQDNFDTVPIKTYCLLPGTSAKYEIIVFDPFNEKFDDIELWIATKEDWDQRTKVDKWINRAGDFSKRKNGFINRMKNKITKPNKT